MDTCSLGIDVLCNDVCKDDLTDARREAQKASRELIYGECTKLFRYQIAARCQILRVKTQATIGALSADDVGDKA